MNSRNPTTFTTTTAGTCEARDSSLDFGSWLLDDRANATRIESDIQAICTALEQYSSNFKKYPGTSSECLINIAVAAEAC